MAYGMDGTAASAQSIAKRAGLAISNICRSRPSCFDFAARKKETVFFVKAQDDVDAISSAAANELANIAHTLKGKSLLIGENFRERQLEDDTVYCRHDVSAITLKTFENIIIRDAFPLIQAGPGGYYVEIDGEAIRRRRQELGMSVGKTAEMVGISRRTLYGYERGMAKASVKVAYKLIHTLGIPLAKSVNVFESDRNRKKCRLLLTAKHMIESNWLLTKLIRKCGRYRVTTVKRAPFDFVIAAPEDKTHIIGGFDTRADDELDTRIQEILSVSRVVQAFPILITERQARPSQSISCICREELSRMKDPEELIMHSK